MPGEKPTPEQVAEQRRMTLLANKKDFARLTLGMFAASFSSFPVEFTYAGQAEAPEGKADVIEVTGEGNFKAKLFIDTQSHLPLMLSWMDKEPLQMNMSSGRGGTTQALPGGGQVRMSGSGGATTMSGQGMTPADMEKMRSAKPEDREKNRAKFMEIMQKLRPKMDAIQKKVDAVLTADQKKKLEAMRAEMRRNFQGGPGRPGGAAGGGAGAGKGGNKGKGGGGL